jgi:hypothetical protein
MNEYIAKNSLTRNDFTNMNVSIQLLMSELFEEMEVLCTQVTTSAIPLIKDDLRSVTEDAGIIKEEIHKLIIPKSLSSRELSDKLEEIDKLNRARANIDAVKQRL